MLSLFDYQYTCFDREPDMTLCFEPEQVGCDLTDTEWSRSVPHGQTKHMNMKFTIHTRMCYKRGNRYMKGYCIVMVLFCLLKSIWLSLIRLPFTKMPIAELGNVGSPCLLSMLDINMNHVFHIEVTNLLVARAFRHIAISCSLKQISEGNVPVLCSLKE